MKNFLLVPNFERNSLPFVQRAVVFLRQNGCIPYSLPEDEGKFGAAVCEDLSLIDCILVFGGDGTMLKTVKKFLKCNIPFAGINTGRVGYLADIEPEATEQALQKLLSGDFTVEKRVTLRVKAHGKSCLGVNEAVLHRTSAHVLGVEIAVNGERVEPVRADGILVATPTGSTAYNLSAGGPILTPQASNSVITPICAHSLSVRPIVIGKKDKVSLIVKNGDPALLTVDGDKVCHVKEGERIDIALSRQTFTLLRLSGGSFFTVLRNKLSIWEK